jgi:hypothetical protein
MENRIGYEVQDNDIFGKCSKPPSCKKIIDFLGKDKFPNS